MALIDWKEISKREDLTAEFIIENKDKLDWYLLSHSKLQEEVLFKCPDKVIWRYLLFYQELSEEFLEEKLDLVEDYMDWEALSYYQNLPLDVIIEYADKLDIEWIMKHYRFTKREKEQIYKNSVKLNLTSSH